MTTLPFTLRIDPKPMQVLLTVEGTPAATDREQTRQAHNMAAGSDQGVAAARSFGDLSHAVFVPAGPAAANRLLFIDFWNSVEGLMQFFSDPQVQKGGEMLFKDRQPVVWAPSPGLPRISLPAPTGHNDRYVGLVKGPVASRDAAEKLLTEATRKALNGNRARGLLSREWFFRADQSDALEAIGLDVWFDADGMQAIYNDPDEMKPLASLFTARPETSVWEKPKGQWVEW
ncbi:MAG TPA: hypothetical protein VHZ56_11020 [Devosia sp.]|nr:hypothetical protein [Devosia sp.]